MWTRRKTCVQEDTTGEDAEYSPFGKILSIGGSSKKVSGELLYFATFGLDDGNSYKVTWSNGDFYGSNCHSKFSQHGMPKNIMVTLGKS
jgi:hypothetical protein